MVKPPFEVHPIHPCPGTRIPFVQALVAAGFPSPAEDVLSTGLDLNEYLVKRPEATFLVRVQGESMLGAGIQPGDILVVDRLANVTDHAIVVAVLQGEFTVKRLRLQGRRIFLMPANDTFPPIEITEEDDFRVWGVVVHLIRTFKQGC